VVDYDTTVKTMLTGPNQTWLSSAGEIVDGVRIIEDALLTDDLRHRFAEVVDKVPPPPPPPGVDPLETFVVSVDKDGLNIRSEPNTRKRAVGKLYNGDSVIVQGKYPDSASGYNFALLISVNGLKKSGYVAREFLKPVPPPPPTGIKGYGPHFLDGQYDAEVAKKYPVVKVMDNPGALVSAHNDNPDRMFIHRRYNKDVDNVPGFIAAYGGAPQAALVWFDMYKADFEQCPWAYHEGPCEAGISADLISFEYERAKLMGDNGYKPLVLNLGVGQTNDSLWKRADMQRLLAIVEKVGGAIGLHCYAEGVMSASSGAAYWNKDGTWSLPGTPLPKTIDPTQSWLALRIVRDRDVIASLGYHPQLIATELGLDDCAAGDSNGIYWPDNDHAIRGWRTCWNLWNKMGWIVGIDAFSFYRCQLKWWVDTTGLPGCVYAHNDRTGSIDGGPGCFDTAGLL